MMKRKRMRVESERSASISPVAPRSTLFSRSRRPRRRRISYCCLLTAAVVLSDSPANAFTSIRVEHRTKVSSISICSSSVIVPMTTRLRAAAAAAATTAPDVDSSSSSPSSSSSLTKTSPPPPSTMDLPPWLARLQHNQLDEEDLQQHLEWLEYALLEQGFSREDVSEVFAAMELASQDSLSKRVGMAEFCRLLLQVDMDTTTAAASAGGGGGGVSLLVTKAVLLASILHFGDCITARETGLYEIVQRAIYQVGVVDTQKVKRLPAELERHDETNNIADNDYDDSSSSDDENIITSAIQVRDVNDILSNSRMLTNSSPLDDSKTASSRYNDFGPDVLRIARGAARLKRAEILAHTVLEYGRRSSKEEAGRLRGLLLSVMEDWRALAIRSVACLYRLEGILKQQQQRLQELDSSLQRTPQIVETAREALRVYAPLAQRLGLQRLKSRLEDRAFRILYSRQYRAVKALYREKGENMQVVTSYLEAQIASVLQENEELMDQLEELRVTSRVKEPYSLWKKLLRMRARNPEKSTGALLHSSTKSSLTSSELSLLDVQDGVALRIVLRARKWEADETDEATRARERLLCYYVQHLLRKHWPVVDPNRIKDYIRFPKENGYQSLHYMSSITSEGEDWPFEVQVRSEEMHRIAEFGVAAHWNYKLGDMSVAFLTPSETSTTAVEPLPPYAAAENKRPIPINTSASYIDALVTARRDLVQQKVFVFFVGSSVIRNKGQLLSLPVGARVSDAIEELESQLDMDLSDKLEEDSIVRNGYSADVNEFVTNGDVLLINL